MVKVPTQGYRIANGIIFRTRSVAFITIT